MGLISNNREVPTYRGITSYTLINVHKTLLGKMWRKICFCKIQFNLTWKTKADVS